MKLNNLSAREQILSLATLFVVVLGAYAVLRFYPAYQAVRQMADETEKMQAAVLNNEILEEPAEDINQLEATFVTLESSILTARQTNLQVEQRLSQMDPAGLRLKISEVARQAGVRINVNVEHKVNIPKPVAPNAKAGAAVRGTLPGGRMGDSAKRAARKARAAQWQAEQQMTMSGMASLLPGQPSRLMEKMAHINDAPRPMQRLVVEADFAGIQRFIRQLDQLEMMVTVVQLQMEATPQTPPPGYSQRLNATMILAM